MCSFSQMFDNCLAHLDVYVSVSGWCVSFDTFGNVHELAMYVSVNGWGVPFGYVC